MIVYGDAERTLEPRAAFLDIARSLARIREMGPGLARHEALATAFIDASELAQALADARFATAGRDDVEPTEGGALSVVMALARALGISWDSGFDGPELEAVPAPDDGLRAALPERLPSKPAEGYAFYALYPEAYWEAAKRLRTLAPGRVVGIRSIGLGLAAMVSSSWGAPPPLTVRPVGHPFARQLALAPEIEAQLADRRQTYAIVDEGPGLSGSSFAAVLDRLQQNGVPAARLHLFPSHEGDPGHMASEDNRARWHTLARHCIGFDALILHNDDRRRRLDSWFSDRLGPALEPLRDVSGGAWRACHFSDEASWPAANVQQERRKYLLSTRAGRFLLKFAGLGRHGRRRLEMAGALGEAGFTPAPLGLRHGFLAENWIAARPLAAKTLPGGKPLARLGAYLGFRAARFAGSPAPGARLEALGEMMRHNIREGLGDSFDAALGRYWLRSTATMAPPRPVATDNRMQVWEWIETEDGRLLKTDALDHCASHDLIGGQDIAWDIAGAGVEFALGDAEISDLAARVAHHSGHGVSLELVHLLTPAYLAFQLGAATMARDSHAGLPAEAARHQREVLRYGDALRTALQQRL